MNVNGYARNIQSDLKPVDLAKEIEKIKSIPYPMDVDVAAGDVDRFAEAIDLAIGMNPVNREVGSLSLCGVPIRKSDLLPANMAALMVNGEVVQLIKF